MPLRVRSRHRHRYHRAGDAGVVPRGRLRAACTFEWTTATETGNLGFYLYALEAEQAASAQ